MQALITNKDYTTTAYMVKSINFVGKGAVCIFTADSEFVTVKLSDVRQLYIVS